jgi:hypothetical protein
LEPVIKAIDAIGSSQSFSWDLHETNIMLRGEVPVITDPLYDTSEI